MLYGHFTGSSAVQVLLNAHLVAAVRGMGLHEDCISGHKHRLNSEDEIKSP